MLLEGSFGPLMQNQICAGARDLARSHPKYTNVDKKIDSAQNILMTGSFRENPTRSGLG